MTDEEYDTLSFAQRRLYRWAHRAGYNAATCWMPSHPRSAWEYYASRQGSALELTTHPWWGDNALFGVELTNALTWYDTAFRATLDMALDSTGDEETLP